MIGAIGRGLDDDRRVRFRARCAPEVRPPTLPSASGRRHRGVSDICRAAPAHETGCRRFSAAAGPRGGAGWDRTQDSRARRLLLSVDDGGEIALHERAAFHVHLQRMARGPGMLVGKHLHPFGIDRRTLRAVLSHTVILMMSSVVPPPASTIAFICANMLAHCASICGGISRGRGVAAENDAGHQEVADAAGVGNRVGVLEAADMDALASRHLCLPLNELQEIDPNGP